MDSLLAVLKTSKGDTNKVNILYQLSEECEEADILKYAEPSLKLAEELNYKKGIAKALNNIAYQYGNQGQIEKALEYFLRSLKIEEEINDKEALINSFNNIAYIQFNQGIIDKSLEYYLQALKIAEEINAKKEIAVVLNNIGRIYKDKGDNEKAFNCYLKSLHISEEINDKRSMAYALTALGAVGKAGSELEYFMKALKLREEINDKPGIVYSLTHIAVNYLKLNNYVQAEKYGVRSLQVAKEIGFPDNISFASSHLSDIYKAQKKYKQAYELQLLYKQMSDSINNQETRKASVKRQMQYEFEKKEATTKLEQERKDVITHLDMQKQMIVLRSVLTGLFLLIIFLGLILNRWRITQRQKQIIEKQKILVDQKNLKITDSINYAKRIQQAILPKEETLRNLFSDSFVLDCPKEIVSGDFYWLGDKGNKKILAVADCTGHGVPGAFMSMIGNTLLNEIVNDEGIEDPAEILNRLRDKVIHSLKQSDKPGVQRDGMEIVVCVVDKIKNELYFAGAQNSIYLIRENILTEYQGDRQSVSFEIGKQVPFTKHAIEIQKGDAIYLFTDGFADQKGGVEKRKFYYKPFRELLISIHQEPMEQQQKLLVKTFDEWKGNIEQIDDVLVLGVKI